MISFRPPGVAHRWPDHIATLSACASSGLPISFSLAPDSGYCTITGARITATSVPTECLVIASQTGSPEYQPADPVTHPYAVDFQLVHFEYGGREPSSPTVSSGPARVTVVATSASPIQGVGVSLFSLTESICTTSSDPLSVRGGQRVAVVIPVRLVASGQCTVTISPSIDVVTTAETGTGTMTFTVGP